MVAAAVKENGQRAIERACISQNGGILFTRDLEQLCDDCILSLSKELVVAERKLDDLIRLLPPKEKGTENGSLPSGSDSGSVPFPSTWLRGPSNSPTLTSPGASLKSLTPSLPLLLREGSAALDLVGEADNPIQVNETARRPDSPSSQCTEVDPCTVDAGEYRTSIEDTAEYLTHLDEEIERLRVSHAINAIFSVTIVKEGTVSINGNRLDIQSLVPQSPVESMIAAVAAGVVGGNLSLSGVSATESEDLEGSLLSPRKLTSSNVANAKATSEPSTNINITSTKITSSRNPSARPIAAASNPGRVHAIPSIVEMTSEKEVNMALLDVAIVLRAITTRFQSAFRAAPSRAVHLLSTSAQVTVPSAQLTRSAEYIQANTQVPSGATAETEENKQHRRSREHILLGTRIVIRGQNAYIIQPSVATSPASLTRIPSSLSVAPALTPELPLNVKFGRWAAYFQLPKFNEGMRALLTLFEVLGSAIAATEAQEASAGVRRAALPKTSFAQAGLPFQVNASEGEVGGIPLVLKIGTEKLWSNAIRLLVINIKWLIGKLCQFQMATAEEGPGALF